MFVIKSCQKIEYNALFMMIFIPVSNFGDQSLISDKTMERRSTSFLRQSISMEIQRGNCASILGTVESPKLLEELFDLFDTKSDHHQR